MTSRFTEESMIDALAIALTALSKIQRWREADSDQYGDQGLFARTTKDLIKSALKAKE